MSYYLQWLKRTKFDPEFGRDEFHPTDADDITDVAEVSPTQLPNGPLYEFEKTSINGGTDQEVHVLQVQELEAIQRECRQELRNAKANPANRGKPIRAKRARETDRANYGVLPSNR